MGSGENKLSGFTRQWLPWCVLAAGLVLYLATLNHWVSFASLPVVARVTGWDWWSINLQEPVLFLATYPFKSLSPGSQPIALNVFGAVCAAGALGLLARTVALLPQDRTREQRERERDSHGLLSIPANWLPPVLAAMACGLQLTFWENATAFTGESFNLLMFAYVVRCLVEFRVTQRDGWLWKAAFVQGAAMTNNWAMIGFLPLFFVAVLWLKRAAGLNLRFLGKLAGFGCVPLLLYLALPFAAAKSTGAQTPFFDALRFELSLQRDSLLFAPRFELILLSLTSFLPVLSLTVRWPSSFGDTSFAGGVLTNLMFYVVHLMFLALCAWVMFDPFFSPRGRGIGYAFLPLYYLAALSVGYYSGYALLVFQSQTNAKAWRRPSLLRKAFNLLATAAVWLAVVGLPAALLYLNLPKLRFLNGDTLQRFTGQLAGSLPEQGAVVLSDDAQLLYLVDAAFARGGRANPHLLINTPALIYSDYHRKLVARDGRNPERTSRWPAFAPGVNIPDRLPPAVITRVLAQQAVKHPMYMLHPGYGTPYLEPLRLVPEGLCYRLEPVTTNVAATSLSPELIQRNQQFWSQAAEYAQAVKATATTNHPTAAALMQYYSRGLNHWGVSLQRLGRLEEAAKVFATARELNADNIAATVNARVNESLRKNSAVPAAALEPSLEEQMGRYRNWNLLLSGGGPFDEPQLCFRLGQSFFQFQMYRQAAGEFSRAWELNPTNSLYGLALAEAYSEGRNLTRAFETLATLKQHAARPPRNETLALDILKRESLVRFANNEFPAAEKMLLDARQQHPDNTGLLDHLFQIYLMSNRITNAVTTLEEQLRISPGYKSALLNLGAIYLQLNQPEKSIPPLDTLLKTDPTHSAALVNRGLANLRLNNLDPAKADFEALQKISPHLYSAAFGLGEVAYHRKDRSTAIKQFKLYQKLAPPGAPEAGIVAQRLQELEGGK